MTKQNHLIAVLIFGAASVFTNPTIVQASEGFCSYAGQGLTNYGGVGALYGTGCLGQASDLLISIWKRQYSSSAHCAVFTPTTSIAQNAVRTLVTTNIQITGCGTEGMGGGDASLTICKDGYRVNDSPPGNSCTAVPTCPAGQKYNAASNLCLANTDKNRGKSCPSEGDPIDPATGNKFEIETDYRAPHPLFRVERTYNSITTGYRNETAYGASTRFGTHWIEYYDRRITTSGTTVAFAWRRDGKKIKYTKTGSLWVPDKDTPDKLTQILSGSTVIGWTLNAGDGTIESYSVNGSLNRIDSPDGYFVTLDYAVSSGNGGDDNASTLDKVVDRFGRELRYSYNVMSLVTQISLPGGGVLGYSYQDNPALLDSVTFPDETPGDATDNPVRTYLYDETGLMDNAALHGYLTGLIDENGHRFGTWAYDVSGRTKFTFNGSQSTTNRVELSYGAPGQPTAATDPLGLTRIYGYSVNANALKIASVIGAPCVACGGGTQSVAYDSNGYKSAESDFRGNKRLLRHDSNGLSTCSVEGVPGPGISPTYRRTLTTWDTSLRVPTQVRTYEPAIPTMAAPTVCDDVPASTAWILRREALTTYVPGTARIKTRTERSLPVDASDADRLTTYAYFGETAGDPAELTGLLKSVDGPRTDVSDITQYFYATATDANHRVGDLTEVRNALSQSTLLQKHDPHGRAVEILDPNNTLTVLTYDPRGRLLSKVVDGHATTFLYDGVGQLDRIAQPDGSFLDYDYDDAHRLTDVRDNFDNVIHYELDAAGNRVGEEVRDPGGLIKREAARIYNNLNQLEKSIGGMGQATTYTYDANSNVVRSIDPRDPAPATPSIYAENVYDALNRVRQVRDEAASTTSTGFDVFGNAVAVTDPRGLVTSYTYSGFGDLKSQVSPDSGTTSYLYDKAGNRTRQIDAKNIAVNYTYDSLNRQMTVDYPADIDTTLTYDETTTGGPGAKGRLTTMVDAAGTTKYQYDKRGNVIRKDVTLLGVAGTFTTHYAYDGADQPTQLTYPSGTVVKYVRTAGQVTDVKVNLGASDVDVLTDIAYEPFGPLKSGIFGNGITLTRTRDLAGRLTDLRHTGALERAYAYDAADNLLTSDDQLNGSDMTYTYDVMSRLTQATGTGGSWPLTTQPGAWGYAYTANGNRTSYTPSPSTGYAYGIVHSPPPTGSNRGEVSAAPHFFDDDYDDGGDRTRSHFGGLSQWHAQTYNDHHGLTHYAYVDDNEWEAPERFYVDYAYNGRRERVRRTPAGPWVDDDPTAGGGLETRHYDEDGQLLAQHRSGGAVFEYLYLDGEPIAFVRSAGLYGGGTKTLYYYHTDHLGTPRRATNQAKAVKWFSVEPYDPFDMLAVSYIAGPGMTFPALRFAGQSTDEMTPFFYNYYRDYDPFKGTYLQSDPIGLAGGLNTYAYVQNNPLRYIDPFGLVQMCHRSFSPTPVPYARHCFARFDDGTTSSFSPGGIAPDPNPNKEGTICTAEKDADKDDCIQEQMKKCKAENYHFTQFNCCHCVEQAYKACGASPIAPPEWPNWPVNPGPQPGEPGYSPLPDFGPGLGLEGSP